MTKNLLSSVALSLALVASTVSFAEEAKVEHHAKAAHEKMKHEEAEKAAEMDHDKMKHEEHHKHGHHKKEGK